MNSGCAFSTLTQLLSGKIWMLMTIVGFTAGVTGVTLILGEPVGLPIHASILDGSSLFLRIFLMILVGILLLLEIICLWSSRMKGEKLR